MFVPGSVEVRLRMRTLDTPIASGLHGHLRLDGNACLDTQSPAGQDSELLPKESLTSGNCGGNVFITSSLTSHALDAQSRAGLDGKPLPTESLMAERDRLVAALSTIDQQIGGARRDLQAGQEGCASCPSRPAALWRFSPCAHEIKPGKKLERHKATRKERSQTKTACLQALYRSDEQELCESRLIILQVGGINILNVVSTHGVAVDDSEPAAASWYLPRAALETASCRPGRNARKLGTTVHTAAQWQGHLRDMGQMQSVRQPRPCTHCQ